MSAVRRVKSFSLVRVGKKVNFKSIEDHEFAFDASDMAVMHRNFGIYAEMGAIAGIAGALRTDPKRGLYEDEVKGAEIHRYEKRLRFFGKNFIEKPPLTSFWEHAWETLQDPMLIILMIAAAVSIIIGAATHPSSGWIEGLAIVLAVVIVTFVGAANNTKQEREFRRLDETQEEERYRVWRAGVPEERGQSEIMVGDLVELAAGDAIPADGLFVYGDDPATNEAKMTGENLNIEKGPKAPFLLAGTELKKGQLAMLVTAVGINTSYGRIIADLVVPPENTPLQDKLEDAARLIGYIGGGVAVVLFVTLVIRWAVETATNDRKFVDEVEQVLDFFIISVTIVVVAIPEGLPLAVTISLAYSMKKMQKDQNLVRILSACETMGNCTAICSDKTGTLTTNQMTVMKGWLAGTFYDNLADAPPFPNQFDFRTLVIEGVVVNSKARKEKRTAKDAVKENQKAAMQADNGQIQPVQREEMVWKGNQTEVALMEWLVKYHIDITKERHQYVVEKNYPFDSEKKNSSVILKLGNKYRRYYKGAGERLFERSNLVMNDQGAIVPIEGQRKEIGDRIHAMTRTGLRTIAFAYQEFDNVETDPNDPNKLLDPPEDAPMVLFGIVGIKDPLRKESRASVRACQRAGVVVRMVTGDHPETAKFIAQEAGIVTSKKHLVMDGEEFRKLMAGPRDEIERRIPMLRVLARSQPEDKRLLVRWLKDQGEIVAATGDGTNDAPALKEAHVGIAMYLVGTAVAKQAAEILILDDNFHSIVKSIMWGRSVFDNIRKFVQFQLTVNVVALGITLIGAFAGFTNPLKAVQLLWVNLIMDTMAALALGTEMPTMKLLQRRPYSKDAPLISKLMWRNIFGQATYQLVILMVLLFAGEGMFDVKEKSAEHFTIIFNSFVWCQIWNEINSRKVTNEFNVLDKFFDNYIFSAILLITILFQFFMVHLFGSFAQTEPISGTAWGASIAIGFGSVPVGALLRLIPVDVHEGEIEIAPDTFEGADLSRGDELNEAGDFLVDDTDSKQATDEHV